MYELITFGVHVKKLRPSYLENVMQTYLFACMKLLTNFSNSFSKNGFNAEEVSNFTTASKNAAKKFKNHSR